jgi:hypothetical protein
MTPTFPARARDRLALLSSPVDGECLAAARTAHKLVEGLGGWPLILVPPIPEGASHLYDWRQAAREVLDSKRASTWEQEFCSNLLGRWRGQVLTRKQETVMKKLHESRCERATA